MAKKGENALDMALSFFLEAEDKTVTPKEIEKRLPRRRATGIVWELIKKGHKIDKKMEKGKIVSFTMSYVNQKAVPKKEEPASAKSETKKKKPAAAKRPSEKAMEAVAVKKKPAAAPMKKAAAKKGVEKQQAAADAEPEAKPATVTDEPVMKAAYQAPSLSQAVLDAAVPEPEPAKWRTAVERGEPVNLDPDMPTFLRRV